MDSRRLFFDSSSTHGGHMLILGDSSSPFFRGVRSMLSLENTNNRRPFFTTAEELLEEVYYDEQLPVKKRRISPEQVHLLERSFEAENKLEPERKSELAKKLGLQPRQVAVWFQNHRARWKAKQVERDYDRLKSSYDALLAEHDALLNDNACLRSQRKVYARRFYEDYLEHVSDVDIDYNSQSDESDSPFTREILQESLPHKFKESRIES